MGKCSYCGKDSGLFRSTHKDCEQRHQTGLSMLRSRVATAALAEKDLPALDKSVMALVNEAFISVPEMRREFICGWQQAVTAALEDDLLTEEEQEHLSEFASYFSLEQEDLDSDDSEGDGSWTKLIQAVVLREVIEGKVPNRVKLEFYLPFVLQKDEQLVWVFPTTGYCEPKVQRSFEGRSSGVSIRVMKGVYYRVGQFKGAPVETTNIVHVDTGTLALTTKQLYFAGAAKNFRIPYGKIMSFKPYPTGLGIWRDVANAKEQIFVTGNGWFLTNLARNLAEQAS